MNSKQLKKILRDDHGVIVESATRYHEYAPYDMDFLGIPHEVWSIHGAKTQYEDMPIYGYYIWKQSIICLTDELKDTNMLKSIFWHEILHAIDMIAGGKLTEEQVRLIGTGFRAVSSDNPDVMKWLR